MDIQKIKNEVLNVLDEGSDIFDKEYFSQYEEDEYEKNKLEKRLETASRKYGEKIKCLVPFITHCNDFYYSFDLDSAIDLISYLNKNSGKMNKIYKFFEKAGKLGELKLSEFVDFLDEKLYMHDCDGLEIKGKAFAVDKMNDLNRGKRLLIEKWNMLNPNEKEIYNYLFRTEENEGFREWLEKQRETKKVKKRFEELGIDYEKWDNPKIAYGYRNEKLRKIESSSDDYIEKVKELATEVMKGNKTGVLKCSPKDLWKEISADYGKIKSYKSGDEPCNENCLYVLEKIEDNLKENVIKDKNGTNGIEKTIKELKKRISSNTSMISDYDFVFKFWERKPSVDFYEGNDSGVCTAFESRKTCIPKYLADKSISLIDILVRGKRMGQLYLVACEKNKEPVLFLDSIEYANNRKIDKIEDEILDSIEPLLRSLNKEIGFKYSCVGNSPHYDMTPELWTRLSMKYENESKRIRKICKNDPTKIIWKKFHVNKNEQNHYLDSLKNYSEFIKIK